MLTRGGGARSKRGRDSQDGQAQAPADGAQASARPVEGLRANAQARSAGPAPVPAEQDEGLGAEPMLLHRIAETDMGYGPDEEIGPPGAGNTDEESDDGHGGANVVTPVGDTKGADEAAASVASHQRADCSSTSSSWPSSFFQRGARRVDSLAPPIAVPSVATPMETLQAGGGMIVLYVPPTTGAASSADRSIASSKLEGIMQDLRQSREADELARRAEEVARAIEDEEHGARLKLQAHRRSQWQAGLSVQRPAGRQRKTQTPQRKAPSRAATHPLLKQHSSGTALMLPAPDEQPPAPAATADQHTGHHMLVVAPIATMAIALMDEHSGQAAWAKASSAISEAVAAILPPALGRNKKGGPLITVKMRDHTNRKRAACQLVSALSMQTCSAILDRSMTTMAERLHDEELYGIECADELVTFFARWGISTLKGALSTLTRLRAFAETKGEYDAADSDTYSAQLVSAFLDGIDARAVKAAEELQSKAEAEGKQLTVQQQRRDGRSAAKTAFRSLRFLFDNAKMTTAARDPLVFKRKFAPTVPMPTPALEPPHYAQLCHLAAHHGDRVVRGTAAGFALTASQTSRFKQAQSCAILAEKSGVIYTAVQLDKSNEPHKQSARPAFGPVLDAFGSRGVVDAVYDALSDIEDGCFLVRDNDSATGAPVDGSAFTNGPLLGGRADAALQYLLTLPPLSRSPSEVQDFKVHSLKPLMLKHAARMMLGAVERHGLGRFSGSAAQNASLVPAPAELKRHQLKCSKLPDRYAQNSAFARDARTAVAVSKDIQRLVREHSIEALAAMEWAEGPDHDEDGTAEA